MSDELGAQPEADAVNATLDDDAGSAAEERSFSPTPEEAFSVLRADHTRALEVALAYDSAEDLLEKVMLSEQLCLLLTVHAQLEEEIFYPALRQAGVQPDLLDEAVVEHMTIRQLVADVESASVEDTLLRAKMHVLTDYVRNHVEEEERELFPVAAASLDAAELDSRLAARRLQLIREAATQMKSRLRSGGPAAQMSMEHPTASVQAMPGPVRAAAAAADLALAVLPGGGRIRKVLRPEGPDDAGA
ncbi:MAG TPA: hemerythrin domain-containing protein [Caulobacteraceae bacterium]|nr:hemerythrin domain-containing protein [Caulobacteraceae bacterium]